MDNDSKYEINAKVIAKSIGIVVHVALYSAECPPWGSSKGGMCRSCGSTHGMKYHVRIKRAGDARRRISFNFWNSYYDACKGKDPGYYDVLCSVTLDASMSTDPDEIVDEFGPMKPSQAIAIAEHARKLQRFFTEEEISKLSEVDQ